ncbi:SDR family oxidoreductase [Comamonas sp. NLF-1-9]|uniref:SDR family oxidoreductase n=1 Tax=Comamonas sp. NLF-1-9 TaxID=2853163 RepID=UPI001C4704B8|nr:SDR family oxidoreductase [Comamonas sp. NLF-1-9]QXL84025.1 SDR family oxidoreductase [Comamonas sp. NLF-1-9]
MDLAIAGRWALVCGASKGLGLGCAQALAAEGVNLVVNARTEAPLMQAASQLRAAGADWASATGQKSPEVIAVAGDITTPEGRDAVWSAPSGPGKDFDIVLTNAGGPPTGDWRGFSAQDWQRALDANMLTPIEIIRAVVDAMAARGYGRILNITSSAVKAPIDILALSNGARSGLTGFIAGLARSGIAAHGVTVNNLLPGKFDTDRLKATLVAAAEKTGKPLEEVRRSQTAQIPARRFGTPGEFGALCAFLCSPQAGYINGQNLLLDGGLYPGTF